MIGHLFGHHPRRTGNDDLRFDHARRQTVVQARRGRLNPAQPASPHHFVPRHGHLGVAAKEVGGRQLFGNPLLPGVDHFGVGISGLDLLDMFGFDRVTENDTHPQIPYLENVPLLE